jgi:plasmid stability protein
MTITITLEDDVVAGLQHRAERRQRSVEELAVEILTAAVEDLELSTPLEVVGRMQASKPNTDQIRPATASLATLLQASPDDPDFNLNDWQRQWAAVSSERAEITHANDVAEGRR